MGMLAEMRSGAISQLFGYHENQLVDEEADTEKGLQSLAKKVGMKAEEIGILLKASLASLTRAATYSKELTTEKSSTVERKARKAEKENAEIEVVDGQYKPEVKETKSNIEPIMHDEQEI